MRFGHGYCRRWVPPGQTGRIRHTPAGAIQHQPSQISLHYLRRIEGDPAQCFGGFPQPDRHPWCSAPGAAGALGHSRLARSHGDQAGETNNAVQLWPARQAGINHDPHTVDGDAGLRNAGGQHDLAAARRWRRNGGTLVTGFAGTVQTEQISIGGQPRFQALGGALNLGNTRQEGEDGAGFADQCAANSAGHGVFQSFSGIATDVSQFDRKHPALRFNLNKSRNDGGETGHIQRG